MHHLNFNDKSSVEKVLSYSQIRSPASIARLEELGLFKKVQDIDGSVYYKQDQQIAASYASSTLENNCLLDIDSEPTEIRKSGLICTIGPASNKVETIMEMLKAGMNIARLNFSHGTHEYHKQTIENLREAVKQYDTKFILAIALDTKGPEIRTGLIDPSLGVKEIELIKGSYVEITAEPEMKAKCSTKAIYVDYLGIVDTMEIHKKIFIDDGLISLTVCKKEGKSLVCHVDNGGKLGNQKGVNLPRTNVNLPAISEKDREDLLFGVENNVDIVFASFVRSGEHVRDIKEVLGSEGRNIKIVSKIENHEGVENFDAILSESDGIMVARGDLGIEISPEKVFVAQKMMIGRCNKARKPVICATQMLESMVTNPRPTRAEVSDVANAILDGSDCVMLSGETAKGAYPVKSVQMMHQICREAESAFYAERFYGDMRLCKEICVDTTEITAYSAFEAANNSMAAAIVVLTTTGRSAHLISTLKPRCPVMMVTRYGIVARQAHLIRGIMPIHYLSGRVPNWGEDVDNRLNYALKIGFERHFIHENDFVVIVTGSKSGSGYTDTMRVIIAHKEENISDIPIINRLHVLDEHY